VRALVSDHPATATPIVAALVASDGRSVETVLVSLQWHWADPLVLLCGWQALHAITLLALRCVVLLLPSGAAPTGTNDAGLLL
jgi:hypothetical protein